jgi:hypothetical protein
VTFTDQSFEVNAGDKKQDIYPYHQLTYLKLDYTNFIDPADIHVLSLFYTRMTAGIGDTPLLIGLHMSHERMIALCRYLLDLGVNFQEYYLGSRSFLQETNIPYHRIRQLKAEYGLEW